MRLALLLMSVLFASIPPLTEDQRVRLETARDGRDHREEAFMALLENVGGAEAAVAPTPDLGRPDPDALLAAPDEYRGALFRLDGVIQQQSPLPRPHRGTWEWFLRDEAGRPLLVYVVGLAPEDAASFEDGRRVTMEARFYKRVDEVARDDVLHRYPAFVGAHPSAASAGTTGTTGTTGAAPLLVVGLPLLLLLLIFAALLLVLRRRAGARRARPERVRFASDPPVLAEEGPLPADPAEALGVLGRRAGKEP